MIQQQQQQKLTLTNIKKTTVFVYNL